MIAAGGLNKEVYLFDGRKLGHALHKMGRHEAAINRVRFNPHQASIVASCGDDKQVKIWDLCRIGAESNPADVEDGDPELIFGHGGHSGKVSDISWSKTECTKLMIASVGEDNRFQVWQPAAACTNCNDEDADFHDEYDKTSVRVE
eukprot:Selendium_serpulae@DN4499_c0_g1_i2.p2